MKLAALFSGGKDSTYAMYKAMKQHDVVCLVSLISENKESYMFHTPNINLTWVQAEAMCMKLIRQKTKGKKEEELQDLKHALVAAKEQFDIDGVVTGAIQSHYQKSRIEHVCNEIGLECLNPLWMRNEIGILKEIVDAGFKVMISGVFAVQLMDGFLGAMIDYNIINRLEDMENTYKIHPSGEGGELETLVVDGPVFDKRMEILHYDVVEDRHSGVLDINKVRLVEK